MRGHVEQTIRVIAAEMNTLGWKEELPESMNGLFLLENNEFIDTDSIRYPRREQMIREATYAELEEMTQEDIDRAREAQEREAENPYSKDKMKNYLEALLGDRTEISSEEVPMKSKRDLLSALSAVAYGSEMGMRYRRRMVIWKRSRCFCGALKSNAGRRNKTWDLKKYGMNIHPLRRTCSRKVSGVF